MFEIRNVIGRGEGCVATRNISRGEIICREKALIPRSVPEQELECFRIQSQYQDDLFMQKEKKLESEIVKVIRLFEKLSSSSKSKYLELSYHQSLDNEIVRRLAKEYLLKQNCNCSVELLERVFNIYRKNAFNNGLFLVLGTIPTTRISSFNLV